MVYIRKCNGSDCSSLAAVPASLVCSPHELGTALLVVAGLESASLPFEMKKTASVSKLLDKNCTFVNGGLWLVKKINVFFLTSLFSQQIYNNYQLNCVALPFKHHYKILGLLFVALKVFQLDVLICIHILT